MNSQSRFLVRIILATLAGGLLLASLRLPLWHMRMEAPQYRGPEALKVLVRPGSLEGNLSEIKILNQYIGVTIPDSLPQTHWLPAILCLCACLGVVAVLLPLHARRFATLAVAGFLSGAMLFAAAQAQFQMYRIGHERNHHAALRGVEDFTPPLLGSKRLAQFELTSNLGFGSVCIAGAVGILAGTGLVARKAVRAAGQRKRASVGAEIPSVAELGVL
jgi:hypothetical protein